MTAIVWVLATQVKNPPFQLLLMNPDLYLSHLQHAGGIVMTRYLLHVGFPMLQVLLLATYYLLLTTYYLLLTNYY